MKRHVLVALREAREIAFRPVALRGRSVEPAGAGFATGAVAGQMVATVRTFALLRGGEALCNDLWRPIP